jgi:hypothetical protein
MADKKISELTAAGALDGTELVPIVQGGETVRTTVALIAGEAAPGAPRYALQFNNPLNTFDGDADALWEPAVGMTLGGATEAAGVVTPGANDIALAVGNYAVPGWVTSNPGGSLYETTSAYNVPLISNAYIEASAGSVSGLAVYTGVNNLTGGSIFSYWGVDQSITITNDSLGDFQYFSALSSYASNTGAGDITQEYAGFSSYLDNYGAGSVNTMMGISSQAYAGCDTTSLYGARIISGIDGAVTIGTGIGVYISQSNSGGTVGDFYGLQIADHSGLGASGDNWNILSEGASSLNVFEGNVKINKYIEQTEMAAPSAPAANGVRIYAQDNGAGKTQLMALFASGAAQQIAIEP